MIYLIAKESVTIIKDYLGHLRIKVLIFNKYAAHSR